jgi:hypothetical protein
MPLADLFVGDPESIKSITADVVPSRDLNGIDVKGIDLVKLTKLHSLINEKPFELALPEFVEAHAVSDDGPWVFECPTTLQAKLATLADAEFDALSKRWAGIQEFALDGFGTSEVRSLLQGLRQMAQSAERTGKRMYLWNSL